LVDISEVLTASIFALIMKAVSISETSVYFHETTRRNIKDGTFILAAVRT
jgi:hypothetical protein